MRILNLDEAPDNPLARIAWLSGVREKANAELEDAFADAYFDARLEGSAEAAFDMGVHSRRQILKLTRKANNARRRMVSWADGLDPSSSAYRGY